MSGEADAQHESPTHHEAQRILCLRSGSTNLASKPVCTYGIHEEFTEREREREREKESEEETQRERGE